MLGGMTIGQHHRLRPKVCPRIPHLHQGALPLKAITEFGLAPEPATLLCFKYVRNRVQTPGETERKPWGPRRDSFRAMSHHASGMPYLATRLIMPSARRWKTRQITAIVLPSMVSVTSQRYSFGIKLLAALRVLSGLSLDDSAGAVCGEADRILLVRMTIVTYGWKFESTVAVTNVAVNRHMSFVKGLASNAVVEGGARPRAMTAVAARVEAFVRRVGVAIAAADSSVKTAQRPAGCSVIEGLRFGRALAPVTPFAVSSDSPRKIHVFFVTTNARTMVFNQRRLGARAVRSVMATGAARFVMTFHTSQPEAVDVMCMAKEDMPFCVGGSAVKLAGWWEHRRVRAFEILVCRREPRRGGATAPAGSGKVTGLTGRFVGPLSMAVEALLVIGALEAGLLGIRTLHGRVVASLASRRTHAIG